MCAPVVIACAPCALLSLCTLLLAATDGFGLIVLFSLSTSSILRREVGSIVCELLPGGWRGDPACFRRAPRRVCAPTFQGAQCAASNHGGPAKVQHAHVASPRPRYDTAPGVVSRNVAVHDMIDCAPPPPCLYFSSFDQTTVLRAFVCGTWTEMCLEAQ